MENNIKSILIIGISGGLAKITATLLSKKFPEIKITGVDNRRITDFVKMKNINCFRINYTRNQFERLFRNEKFDIVFHLGRMSHANANPRASLAQRLDLNVMGTNRIFELALKFGIKKTILMSTWHVYGANPDNPVFIKEDTLLRASIKYPELRDVVEMDQLASNWMWKYQHEMETVILRPCSIIGPQINNTITKYLTTSFVPLPIDFNPMMQFIHEFDMANILTECITNVPTGIYNIATDESTSIKKAKKIIGLPTAPIPIFLLEQAAKIINKTIWSVPDYLIDYLKYPCLLSNSEIKRHLPANIFRFSTRDSLELLKMD